MCRHGGEGLDRCSCSLRSGLGQLDVDADTTTAGITLIVFVLGQEPVLGSLINGLRGARSADVGPWTIGGERGLPPAIVRRPKATQISHGTRLLSATEEVESAADDRQLIFWVIRLAGGVAEGIVDEGGARGSDRPGDIQC